MDTESSPCSPSSAASGTVILVHGLGRSPINMAPLARMFGKRGYQTRCFGYASRSGTLDFFTDNLQSYLEAARSELKEPLHFVGHSLGSIVIRRFAQRFCLRWKLGRCVMLGPPNQTSAMARLVGRAAPMRWLLGPVLSELGISTLSDSVGGLEVGIIAGGTGNRGFSPLIAGDNDFLVAVEETKLLSARDFIQMPAFHGIMMFQPKVMRQTLYFIEHGRFQRAPLRALGEAGFPDS